eukprot:1160480-Pelagomonas_calceolata.AAC.3
MAALICCAGLKLGSAVQGWCCCSSEDLQNLSWQRRPWHVGQEQQGLAWHTAKIRYCEQIVTQPTLQLQITCLLIRFSSCGSLPAASKWVKGHDLPVNG